MTSLSKYFISYCLIVFFQVITDESFSRHQGFDLATFRNTLGWPQSDLPTFQVPKTETYDAFKSRVSERFNLRKESFRFWALINRENKTIRVDCSALEVKPRASKCLSFVLNWIVLTLVCSSATHTGGFIGADAKPIRIVSRNFYRSEQSNLVIFFCHIMRCWCFVPAAGPVTLDLPETFWCNKTDNPRCREDDRWRSDQGTGSRSSY